jgi:hypothetical protein
MDRCGWFHSVLFRARIREQRIVENIFGSLLNRDTKPLQMVVLSRF